MKKAICVILALASAFTLTGCTSVYSNFKEIEQLLVIQDMGLDKQGGGVLLCVGREHRRRAQAALRHR